MNPYKSGPWLVFIAAILWAMDTPFRKYLTESLSSATIVLMEHITIAVLVLIFLWKYLSEFKNLGFKEWLAVSFIGFGGSALATVLFTQSFHYLNPSVSILLQKIQPFIAILLAVLVLKEKLSKKFWLWALVGIFGAYLLAFPALKLSGFSLTGGTLGVVFALLASILWGGSTVFGRVVLKKISYQAMTAARFLSALVFLIGLEIYYRGFPELRAATLKDWMFVFVIAIIAGFVSLFIYYRGLRYTNASVATIAELAFPFSAVIVNWIFLDAKLAAGQILGGLVLLFAIMGLTFVNTKESEVV
ncbi:DMT family transporter [bacterium]|nr:MAG: DMT family transporter [bacterium]